MSVFRHFAVVHDLAHLSVEEGVSDYHLFLLNILRETFAFKGQVVKVETQRTHAAVAETLLELLQLLDKGASDFKVWSS